MGPFGTYFGRTIGEIRSRLVLWTVPGSGGRKVLVHAATLPALRKVAEGLAANAAAGRVYPITQVSSFNARTVADSRQMSRHTLGIAIDINYPQNPYRADAKLITDMPAWFVEVWRDAGFCWGGDWKGEKDPMHFSWMGPKGTPDPSATLRPLAPKTAKAAFGAPAAQVTTIFAPVMGRYAFSVADGDGNGAPDIAGLRSHPEGSVIDVSTGGGMFGACSIVRFFVPDPRLADGDRMMLTDVDGDSRQDLVSFEGAMARVATRRDDYGVVSSRQTALDTAASAVAAADFDGDHRADLWATSPDGWLRVYGGESWNVLLHQQPLPDGAPTAMAVGDRDGGNLPEVLALYPSGGASRVEVLELSGAWQVRQSVPLTLPAGSVAGLGASDYDGDGRADLEVFDTSGRLEVRLGNTKTGIPANRWFAAPGPCQDAVKLAYQGSFFDDDSSVHQKGIEAMAAAGITKGCNPPFNDMYCPKRVLTRAEAAALLARALDLPAAASDHFRDDAGHVLEGAINRLAEAGISKGCNPPANDRFCPNRSLTRAEFAAFVVRALGLPAPTADHFVDDKGHVLEAAINRLAEAGITQGCNPPANDRFCPNRALTRAETATLLTRALG